MKKNDIVKKIASRLYLSQAECEMVLDAFADVVKEAFENGETKVRIRDFITFEVSEYRARKGYNPYTGKSEDFAPSRTVKCSVGKTIKEAVKRSATDEYTEILQP